MFVLEFIAKERKKEYGRLFVFSFYGFLVKGSGDKIANNNYTIIFH